MNINIILILLLVLIILSIGIYFIFPRQNQKINMNLEKNQNLIIRQPAVAGQFYPSDKNELSQMIDNFLNNVKEGKYLAEPKILIVPHAGYVFSGQTAAYGFKQLIGKKYNKVIFLGNSHQEYFEGLYLDNSDIWQTPLGQVEIDKNLISQLVNDNDKIKVNQDVHLSEHSLEVELPFLQKLLDQDFKLMPGLFGSYKNLQDLKSIAQSLKNIIDDQTLVIISSDLSHYPNYEDAKIIDWKTLDAILAMDANNFLQTINELENQDYENLSTCACGWPAIITGIYLSNEMNLEGELLNYMNSGDVAGGDKSKVVGYVSLLFKTQNLVPNEVEGTNNKTIDNHIILNQKEQEISLKLARQTLENAFDKNKLVDEDYKNYDIFQQRRGVFVTLHKDGELRGCIGLIEPPEIPLSQAIQEMSLSAAFKDHRFLPLTKKELDKIKIEISVLTLPEKITDVNEIELGKHGVILKKGINQGVFLPQVATETGWAKEQFLSELCFQKAGLNKNCWQNTKVEIYIFEAQIFSE